MNSTQANMATMPFGKYYGKRVLECPISYLEWLLDQAWFQDEFTDLIDVIKWGQRQPWWEREREEADE